MQATNTIYCKQAMGHFGHGQMDLGRSIGSTQVGQMSRASDLRDAVANAIQAALPTVDVQTTVVANYDTDVILPIGSIQAAYELINMQNDNVDSTDENNPLAG